jgi:ABC-type branched-subunit amino acid transport system ATPase component
LAPIVTTVLAAYGLRRAFGEESVIAGLDLEVGAGELVLVVGANGAGKSTLLRLLAGVEKADAGTVVVRGKTHRRVFLPQEPVTFENLSVAECFAILRLPAGAGLADLPFAPGTRCRHLSGGQRKVLGLALGTAMAPGALFLDEPDAGLDTAAIGYLVARIDDVRRTGSAVVVASHNPPAALLQRAARLLRLASGVLSEGTTVAPTPKLERSPIFAARGASPVLEVRGLSIARAERSVLRDISFDVGVQEVVWLSGANGQGKSSLCLALAGLIPATGKVTFMTRDLACVPALARARLGLLHVMQAPSGVFLDLTVDENLEVSRARSHNGSDNKASFCRRFPELETRIAVRAGALSGGLRRLLAVGMALQQECALLVLDELFAHLSESLAERAMDYLLSLPSQPAILVLEHHSQVLENARVRRLHIADLGSHRGARPLAGDSE